MNAQTHMLKILLSFPPSNLSSFSPPACRARSVNTLWGSSPCRHLAWTPPCQCPEGFPPADLLHVHSHHSTSAADHDDADEDVHLLLRTLILWCVVKNWICVHETGRLIVSQPQPLLVWFSDPPAENMEWIWTREVSGDPPFLLASRRIYLEEGSGHVRLLFSLKGGLHGFETRPDPFPFL